MSSYVMYGVPRIIGVIMPDTKALAEAVEKASRAAKQPSLRPTRSGYADIKAYKTRHAAISSAREYLEVWAREAVPAYLDPNRQHEPIQPEDLLLLVSACGKDVDLLHKIVKEAVMRAWKREGRFVPFLPSELMSFQIPSHS